MPFRSTRSCVDSSTRPSYMAKASEYDMSSREPSLGHGQYCEQEADYREYGKSPDLVYRLSAPQFPRQQHPHGYSVYPEPPVPDEFNTTWYPPQTGQQSEYFERFDESHIAPTMPFRSYDRPFVDRKPCPDPFQTVNTGSLAGRKRLSEEMSAEGVDGEQALDLHHRGRPHCERPVKGSIDYVLDTSQQASPGRAMALQAADSAVVMQHAVSKQPILSSDQGQALQPTSFSPHTPVPQRPCASVMLAQDIKPSSTTMSHLSQTLTDGHPLLTPMHMSSSSGLPVATPLPPTYVQKMYTPCYPVDMSHAGSGSYRSQELQGSLSPADNPGPKRPAKRARTNIEVPKEIAVQDIKIEGEPLSVPVYDTCDTVRQKIAALLKQDGISQAAFLRELGKVYEPPRKLQSKSLHDFMNKSGPRAGNTSCIYYSAYVVFEKIRVRDGVSKSEDRLTMEKIYGTKGCNTTEIRARVYPKVGEATWEDQYGRIHTQAAQQ